MGICCRAAHSKITDFNVEFSVMHGGAPAARARVEPAVIEPQLCIRYSVEIEEATYR